MERARQLELERGGERSSLERARQLELEQRLLADKLRQQQFQSEEDSRWLHQEENNLVSEKILRLSHKIRSGLEYFKQRWAALFFWGVRFR